MNATTVKPFAPRHVTSDLGDSLHITLPSRKYWLNIIPAGLFVVVWLVVTPVMLVLGGAAVLSSLNAEFVSAALAAIAFPALFGLVWLSFWTVGGLVSLYTVLWGLAGREVIDVSVQSIRLSRRVPGWGRVKEYLAEHIQDLRVSPQAMPDWYVRRSLWSAARGQIAFDYGARTIRFGDADEAEARMILEEIRTRFPQYRPRATGGTL